MIPQLNGVAELQPLPDPIGVLKRGGIDAHIIEDIYGCGHQDKGDAGPSVQQKGTT